MSVSAGGLARTQFGALLEDWLNAVSIRAYKKKPAEFKPIFKMMKGEGHLYRAQDLRGFGLIANVGELEQIPFLNTSQGYTHEFPFRKFAAGYKISSELMADNRYKSTTPEWSRLLGDAAIETKEYEAVKVFNDGFDVASFPDGKPWFSTTHTGVGGIELSNVLATAKEWSEETYEDMQHLVEDQRLDTGYFANLMPKAIVCHNTKRQDVCRVMDSPLRSDTANNDINAMLKLNGTLPVYVMRRLTRPGSVFMLTDTDRPLKLIQRQVWKTKFFPDESVDATNNVGIERYVFANDDFASAVSNGKIN